MRKNRQGGPRSGRVARGLKTRLAGVQMKDAKTNATELPPIISLRDREHVLAREFDRAARNFAAPKRVKSG